MNLLATLALDLVLAFVVLLGMHGACAWGELCGIRPGRDKSGLGGFAAVFLLTGMRWLGVALILGVTTGAGERWWLLAAHLALGALAAFSFDRCLRRVQHDRPAPAAIGVFAGVLLPMPALTLAIARANLGSEADSAIAFGLVAGALLLLHGICFHRRRADMLRSGTR